MAPDTYAIPRPTEGDVVELILDDHRLFEELLRAMRDPSADRAAARAAFSGLLIAHSEAEETRVYPDLASDHVIDEHEGEHGEEEHAACNAALLRLLEAEDTSSSDYDAALEAVSTSLGHHLQEEESSILGPARESASTELRERLGVAWAARRTALLDEDCGSLAAVRALVERDAAQGLLPGDEQPERG